MGDVPEHAGGRTERIAADIDVKSREMVEFFAGLGAADLSAACADPNGATVGAVLEHLDEGYDLALGWLRLAADGQLPASAAPPAHDHSHDHDHDHDHGERDPAAAIEHLKHGGEAWSAMVRGFTPGQMSRIPPATPGITDGSTPIGEILLDLVDHQMTHLAYAQQAVAARRATAGRPA